MKKWKTALFDTCSLLAVDRLVVDRPGFARLLPKQITVLSESVHPRHVSEEAAQRLHPRITRISCPPLAVFRQIICGTGFTVAASEVEKQLFASAVHHELPVITSEKELANALRRSGHDVASFVWVLWSMVTDGRISKSYCIWLISRLLDHGVAPRDIRPTWKSIEAHVVENQSPPVRRRSA